MRHTSVNDSSGLSVRFWSALSILLFFVLQSCTKSQLVVPVPEGYTTVSANVQYQYIGTYDSVRLQKIRGAGLDSFLASAAAPSPMRPDEFRPKLATPKYPVKLYRVRYQSVVPEWGNKPTISSGLVAIPDNGKDLLPMISYQHGTVFGKKDVPSYPDSSMETQLMLLQFASQGYVVIGADYHGYGISTEPASYFAKASTEQAMLDMYYAAIEVLGSLKIKKNQFIIHGWSQGGYNTMTFLRKLESLNIPVLATCTAAAPVEVAGVINRWMNNYQPGDALFLPASATNFFFVKEYYDNLPGLAKQAIRSEYYDSAKAFYEFRLGFREYLTSIKLGKIKDILNPEFMATGNLASSDFWLTLERMQAYRWRPVTPIINYYGEADEVIPTFIATKAEEFHKFLGVTTTKAISAGPRADHRATYVHSVAEAKSWYDSLVK